MLLMLRDLPGLFRTRQDNRGRQRPTGHFSRPTGGRLADARGGWTSSHPDRGPHTVVRAQASNGVVSPRGQGIGARYGVRVFQMPRPCVATYTWLPSGLGER
ncbi:hypothetical protein GCM10014715_81770 [Streptomyces spiralis]|uniref:Uncharacterized protein n=1 Tax=Streptomyces spiralis TaxID=66376 RepID=A0A919AN39_9ACTN|nr:hypothetical protein GCM10014715_81770 [Streptomyces spiralis]